MPGGDGTGPMGMGSMTGRRAGFCAGYSAPGYVNSVPGRGFSKGRGFGRGFGFTVPAGRQGWAGDPYAYGNPYAAPTYPANFTTKQEADMLKTEAKAMQDEIDTINQRVKDLESAQESEGNE